MSSTLEDRLTAALHARADLIQPEDLQQSAPPAPLRLRRPTALLAAASVVIAGTIAAVLLTDDEDKPEPAKPLPDGYVEVDRLSGDVDGDGRDDLVRHARAASPEAARHAIVIDLSDGVQTKVQLQYRIALLGLADLGRPGRAVVTREPKRLTGGTLAVYLVNDGGIDRVERDSEDDSDAPWEGTPGRRSVRHAFTPGLVTWWDFGVSTLQRPSLYSWSLDDGELVSEQVGSRCWRRSQPVPTECPEITEIPSGYVTGPWDAVDLDDDGALDQIRVASRQGDPDKGNPVVIVRLSSGENTGLYLPADGPPPAALHQLQLPEGKTEVPVLAVEGDFPGGGPLSLYRVLDGRLTEVRVNRDAPVDPNGPGKQVSWARVRDGVLVGWTANTSRTPAVEVRVDVYSFKVDGTQLIPVREGERCFNPEMDEFPHGC